MAVDMRPVKVIDTMQEKSGQDKNPKKKKNMQSSEIILHAGRTKSLLMCNKINLLQLSNRSFSTDRYYGVHPHPQHPVPRFAVLVHIRIESTGDFA